jgi:hypothetical protein
MTRETAIMWFLLFSLGGAVILFVGLWFAQQRKWPRAERVLWTMLLCWPF